MEPMRRVELKEREYADSSDPHAIAVMKVFANAQFYLIQIKFEGFFFLTKTPLKYRSIKFKTSCYTV